MTGYGSAGPADYANVLAAHHEPARARCPELTMDQMDNGWSLFTGGGQRGGQRRSLMHRQDEPGVSIEVKSHIIGGVIVGRLRACCRHERIVIVPFARAGQRGHCRA